MGRSSSTSSRSRRMRRGRSPHVAPVMQTSAVHHRHGPNRQRPERRHRRSRSRSNRGAQKSQRPRLTQANAMPLPERKREVLLTPAMQDGEQRARLDRLMERLPRRSVVPPRGPGAVEPAWKAQQGNRSSSTLATMSGTAQPAHILRRAETKAKQEKRAMDLVGRDQCLACGSMGHRKADCQYKADSCSRCGRTGHVDTACWRVTSSGGEALEPGTMAVPKASQPKAKMSARVTVQPPAAPSAASEPIHTEAFRQEVMERTAQLVAQHLLQQA